MRRIIALVVLLSAFPVRSAATEPVREAGVEGDRLLAVVAPAPVDGRPAVVKPYASGDSPGIDRHEETSDGAFREARSMIDEDGDSDEPALDHGDAIALPKLADGDRMEVVFLGLVARGDLQESAFVLESMLVNRLEELGRVEVVRNRDVSSLAGLDEESLLRGGSESCKETMSVLEALEAPLLLIGELHEMGGRYLVMLTLLASDATKIVARVGGEARSERALLRRVRTGAWELLVSAGLDRSDLGPRGLRYPRFHLTAKAGNSLASIASNAVSGRLHGGRLNLELGYYAANTAVVFVEAGATWGRVRDPAEGAGALNVDIFPAGVGVKKLWVRGRSRVWLGGSVGAGFLGLFLGGSNDLTTALSTTAVVGIDRRLGSRWALLVEASTSLTDAVIGYKGRPREEDQEDGEAGELLMPVHGGLTLGLTYFLF